MGRQKLLNQIEAYYTGKVREHGATHRGVDWNSTESQELRFRQLLKIVRNELDASVNDYGCGYGAMARYMREHGYKGLYYGFDLSPEMIQQARSQQANIPCCDFFSEAARLVPAHFTIASGIFNVKQGADNAEWQQYVLDTLDTIAATSTRGFSFNMLTSYSDADHMRPDLFYGDPCFFTDYCIRHFSRHVAMLHDYGLYEVTLLVRLNQP